VKIKISKIDDTTFTVREKLDPEYINELKESLKEDGQWNPILVRPKGEGYELIGGHNRVQAAKELGWKEIEATVKDLSDLDAMFLSIKTNLLRQEMSQVEQGRVLKAIMETTKLSGAAISEKIGKSPKWVTSRVQLALDLHETVAKALADGGISNPIALIISSVDKSMQPALLKVLKSKNITNEDDARRERDRFLNNTIYTIGYEGKDLQQFIEVLKNNGIMRLIDVRFSAESQYKPDFNKSILARELDRAKIKYEHHPDLGIPYEWQNPYKDGAIPIECLEKYYKWHTEKEMDFKKFVDEIKSNGKTVLMCMEKHAKPTRDQKIHCHRHILANLILATGEFKERIDL